ncbi:MAG TPA: hypothetical protein PKD53_09000 [Chloroflexaceae bacterium]|nr:hypothetical protein [Chloroflexaceae bacterium]
MRFRRMLARLTLAALAAATLAACSPEAGRERGGGPGAMSSNVPPGGVEPKSKVFASEDP